MNTRKYISLCNVSHAKSYAELNDLAEKRCLLVAGAEHSGSCNRIGR